MPAAAFEHRRQHRVDRIHGTEQVDIDDLFDSDRLQVARFAIIAANTGIGDEDVDMLELMNKLGRGRRDRIGIGNVAGKDTGRAAGLFAAGFEFIEHIAASGEQSDDRSFLCKCHRQPLADAARRSGQKDAFSMPIHSDLSRDRSAAGVILRADEPVTLIVLHKLGDAVL